SPAADAARRDRARLIRARGDGRAHVCSACRARPARLHHRNDGVARRVARHTRARVAPRWSRPRRHRLGTWPLAPHIFARPCGPGLDTLDILPRGDRGAPSATNTAPGRAEPQPARDGMGAGMPTPFAAAVLLAVVAAAPAAGRAATTGGEIPLTHEGGVYSVQVTVNDWLGRPFLGDSGPGRVQ